MIDHNHALPIAHQCRLLDVARSTVYYRKAATGEQDLSLMRLIDQLHLKWPFMGSRQIRDQLGRQGHRVNRKRVQRLMRQMGLAALYPKKKTSIPDKEHVVYPYLLRDLKVTRPGQVYASDLTYIPMAKGFLYLTAVIDWYSRKVLSWRLSNTMDAAPCVEALQEAIARYGAPEIFNTDQGAQFTSKEFTGVLKAHDVKISMDGKGRWLDNVFVERLWRSLKYEEVYLKAYETVGGARQSIDAYLQFFNRERTHQSLERRTPDQVFFGGDPVAQAA